MIYIIYTLVIAGATFLGAMAGLGGGVIIKPTLDFIGAHDLSTISFLSTSAVFTMSVYSIGKQIIQKTKFDLKMIFGVSSGAIIGGYLGSYLFSLLLQQIDNNLLISIQSFLLSLLLVLVIININFQKNTKHIDNLLITFLLGITLGTISAFLGIGGGPMNVAVFTYFFSLDLKTATVYSLATILFSQLSKLINIATSTGFAVYDLSLLIYILPAAIIGGIFGSMANKKVDTQTIRKVFNIVVFALILLNLYNGIICLIK